MLNRLNVQIIKTFTIKILNEHLFSIKFHVDEGCVSVKILIADNAKESENPVVLCSIS